VTPSVLRLASDALEVEVLPELGARIHRLRFRGHDILRAAPDPSAHEGDPFFWGSYVMAPWCGRVEAGVTTQVGGRALRLPTNFPDGTAIHGQVYARPWELVAASGSGEDGPTGASATFRVLAGGDAWPWPHVVEQRIAAHGATLAIDLALTNRADDPMPAGIGIHPWFMRPLRLSVDAGAVFASNTEPSPEPVRVEGRFDLRALRDVPDDLDGCWTAIGPAQVRFAWPALGARASMHADATTLHVAVASPTTLDAVAVEPQTHVPQGLRRVVNREPGALTMLAPGATLRLSVELAFEMG
jgi:aldose 1-epimerase